MPDCGVTNSGCHPRRIHMYVYIYIYYVSPSNVLLGSTVVDAPPKPDNSQT